MPSAGKIIVLFLLGFGPIVRDKAESRKLYRESLGIPFKEESAEVHSIDARREKETAPKQAYA
jgi:hypothetical protein